MKAFKTLLLTACVLFVGARVESATLTITTTGAHTGVVSVVPTAQLCYATGGGNTCTFTIANGTQLSLGANSPSTPGIFSAGTGDAAACAPTSTCKFTMNGDSSIVASFNPGTYPYVQIVLAGDGKGEVSTNNSQCQNFELGYSGCTSYYGAGSEVTLASPLGARQPLHELLGGHCRCQRVRDDESVRVYADDQQRRDRELCSADVCCGAAERSDDQRWADTERSLRLGRSVTAPRDRFSRVRDCGAPERQ